jgi:hypothetical protein
LRCNLIEEWETCAALRASMLPFCDGAREPRGSPVLLGGKRTGATIGEETDPARLIFKRKHANRKCRIRTGEFDQTGVKHGQWTHFLGHVYTYAAAGLGLMGID